MYRVRPSIIPTSFSQQLEELESLLSPFEELESLLSPWLERDRGTNGTFRKNNIPDLPTVYRDNPDLIGISIPLPGFTKEKITVTVTDPQTLVVEGKEHTPQWPLSSNLKPKMKTQTYRQVFTLSENSDIKAITSKYIDGILYIEIPKKPKQQNNYNIPIL